MADISIYFALNPFHSNVSLNPFVPKAPGCFGNEWVNFSYFQYSVSIAAQCWKGLKDIGTWKLTGLKWITFF